jgi:tRNA pseudouridine38-40 synthase
VGGASLPRVTETETMHRDYPRNVKLTIEYDGSAYHGWQRQANAPTVQQAMEEALAGVVGHPVTLTASGRTDAGVHALGQVANFYTRSTIPADRLPLALNAALPPDIAVQAAADVPLDFHARYAATGKTYRYTVLRCSARPAVERRTVAWLRRDLDLAAMRAAAALFVGTHDFAAFRTEAEEGDNSVRTVTRCGLEARPDHGGERIEITVSANGFLYNMVRSIVGTLLVIGRGKWPPERVAELLAAPDRARAGPTAPARGLCLMEVRYDRQE